MSDAMAISRREAARILSVSLRTIDNLIAMKKLKTFRVGRRVLIPTTVIAKFVAAGSAGNRGRVNDKGNV